MATPEPPRRWFLPPVPTPVSRQSKIVGYYLTIMFLIWGAGFCVFWFVVLGSMTDQARWNAMTLHEKKEGLAQFMGLWGVLAASWWGAIALMAVATASVQEFYLSILNRMWLRGSWIYRRAESRSHFWMTRMVGIFGLCLTPVIIYGWFFFVRALS